MANKAQHLTPIPLRFIAAGELGRSTAGRAYVLDLNWILNRRQQREQRRRLFSVASVASCENCEANGAGPRGTLSPSMSGAEAAAIVEPNANLGSVLDI